MQGQNSPPVPPLDAYSDLPLYNTKAVVHQTGVPAPTLRAWERRYRILRPQRGDNDYRLYSERDIMTIGWLRTRVLTGMTISQAIALLKSLQVAQAHAERRTTTSAPARNGHGPRHASPPAQALQVTAPARFALDEMRQTLLAQITSLDEVAARRTIAQALSVFTVEDVCLRLLEPLMIQIGDLWRDGVLSVTVEHFASGLVRSQLESLFRGEHGVTSGPLLLVGCAPGELHELGALMLALFLRRAGLRVAYLGQTVEFAGLLDTVRRLRPAAVLLSAALTSVTPQLAEIGRALANLDQPRPLFCFGGQVFSSQPDLAAAMPGVYLSGGLAEAALAVREQVSR